MYNQINELKECLETAMKRLSVLEQDLNTPEQVLASRTELGARYGVSPEQIDKMARMGIFLEEVHFTRLTPGGKPRYYIAKCDEQVLPKKSLV